MRLPGTSLDSGRVQRMEDNLHTSVVIELANQEDPEQQKSLNAEFDETDIPKDYVIDQIFCGENITVYALFEIPEMRNQKSDVDLSEIQNSAASDDSRHIPRSSLKKTVQMKSNTYSRKLPPKGSDEDLQWCARVTNDSHRSRSIYCLKQGQNHEIPQREEDATDLKVLFSKDFISKGSKQMKFKAVSKGVNTDIAQSPKVIEDIQRAIDMGFTCERGREKSVEISNIPFANTPFSNIPLSNFPGEIIETDGKQSSISSFSSDAESMKHGKGSSPNYLFVPLLMIEERFMSHFQKEEKILANKSRINPKTVSLGTNTETVESSPLTSEIEERREHKSHFTKQSEASKALERNEEKEHKNAKSHLKKKDKNTILNEIRKLQGKLNSLIKSIEYNELSLSTDEDDKYSEMSKRTSEAGMKNLSKTSEPQLTDSEMLRRSHNRYDDIPIFSSLFVPPPPKSKKVSPKKKTESSDRGEEKKPSADLVKAVSSICLAQQEKISSVENITGAEVPEVNPKNVFSGLKVNWESKIGKSLGPSKSDTSSRCSLLLPKHTSLKKSMSFDLRDEKVEMYGLKKIKNSSFKFEGSLKTKNGDVRLGENLTSLRREMGDEAKTKLRVSGAESADFHEDSVKEEVIFLKNGALDIKKSLNEEEGDAKLMYPNQNLVSQKFVQDSEVHFCRPDVIASDALLKSVKMTNSPRGKSKTVKKTDESGTKACSDTEKPTTPSRTRKNNAVDTFLKKEVNPVKKTNTRIKIWEKKSERKETTGHEFIKPKSVSGSRKFTVKGTAESKLHVDKLIRIESESRNDNANNQKATKANTDEKSGGRPDRLPRPLSQKREHRENAPETTEKKEAEKASKKKSDTVVEIEHCLKKKSPEGEVEENVEKDKIIETKKEMADGSDRLPSNSSSVVVELFSEKPKLGEEFYSEVNDDYGNFGSIVNGRSKGSESESQGKRNCGSQDKPIVKSIWALTKVLLYEDGTKKLEVLEASLTPPGYCLNSTENKPTENVSE